jgi:membrane associated rhomboid family serine protease
MTVSGVTLLRERGHGAEMALVVVVPAIYGAVTGYFLGESEAIYTVLALLGILGGLVAGLEHESPLEGFYRGLLGGLIFGTAILVTNGLLEEEPKAHLPDPEVLLIVITGGFGALLGALGGWLQARKRSG